MNDDEAVARARQEREDRDAGIVREPDRYVLRRGLLYSQAEIETIFDRLRPQRDDVVADLGCGVGRISLALAPKVRRVVALDVSVNSLRFLETRCSMRAIENVHPLMADVRRLPVASLSCDAAVCCQVLQHVPHPRWRDEVIGEVFRILRPGGRLVFTVYQWGTMVRDRKEGDFCGRGYRRAFEVSEVLALLTTAGFEATQVAGVIHLPHALIRRLPVFLWPLEVAVSRRARMLGRATYLLGFGRKPSLSTAASPREPSL